MGKNVAFVLAGLMLLLIGGGVVFWLLKRKEIAKVADLQKKGAFTAAAQVAEGAETLLKIFTGKKSMT